MPVSMEGLQVAVDAVEIEIHHAYFFRNQIHVWLARRGDHQHRFTGDAHGHVAPGAEQGSEVAVPAQPLAAIDDVLAGLKVRIHGFSFISPSSWLLSPAETADRGFFNLSCWCRIVGENFSV
jgi:hypothetical protein